MGLVAKIGKEAGNFATTSPLALLINQCENPVELLIRHLHDQQKGYEAQLQKLEGKIRKHAKVEAFSLRTIVR